MRIFFEQIPEGAEPGDYPPDTIFVLDDTRPKRDPVTFKIIIPEPRPKVSPKQAWEVYRQTHPEKIKD